MKSSNACTLFSRLTVFSLAISLLCVQTSFAFTIPAKAVSAAEITVTGPRDGAERPFVLVNGEQAFSGRTFFSNGTVATTGTSSATVSLGKLGRIEVAPSSSMSLSFSDGRITGSLSKGSVSVSNMDGVSVTIDTPHDSVTNEGTSPSRFTVAVLEDRTGVTIQSGTIRHNGGEIASKQDDDDDDDDDNWKAWAVVGVVAGAIVLVVLLSRDDDDDVSPVR